MIGSLATCDSKNRRKITYVTKSLMFVVILSGSSKQSRSWSYYQPVQNKAGRGHSVNQFRTEKSWSYCQPVQNKASRGHTVNQFKTKPVVVILLASSVLNYTGYFKIRTSEK